MGSVDKISQNKKVSLKPIQLASISHKPGVNIFIRSPVNPVGAEEKIYVYVRHLRRNKRARLWTCLKRYLKLKKVTLKPLILASISHKPSVIIFIRSPVNPVGAKDINQLFVKKSDFYKDVRRTAHLRRENGPDFGPVRADITS